MTQKKQKNPKSSMIMLSSKTESLCKNETSEIGHWDIYDYAEVEQVKKFQENKCSPGS